MNLGRHQLLQWINYQLSTEYNSIEHLADGIAYCQILQAIHPGCVNMSRLNFLTKYPEDCLRNLKLLEDALKKIKITQPVSFEKMAQGKFQDNIVFLQWLYAYTRKIGLESISNYDALSRRIQLIEKQGRGLNEINTHLLPNEIYRQQVQYETQPNEQEIIEQKIDQIREYTISLENEIKDKMESNWRLMHLVDKSIEDRNTIFLLLQQIEKIILQTKPSTIQQELLGILKEDIR